MKKDRKFVWIDEHQRAFEKLKLAITTAQILKNYDLKDHTRVYTNSSMTSYSGIFEQCSIKDNPADENSWHPCGYFSKKIPKVDQNKPVHLLELIAVAESLKAFDYYLLRKQFTVLTDSKAVSFYDRSVSRTPKTERIFGPN